MVRAHRLLRFPRLRRARNAAVPAVLLLLGFAALPARAQLDAAAQARNRPVPPYRIAGNLYSVGAAGVASFLFVTKEGSILLDGGFPETAPQIRDNLRTLGFRIEDVKILLVSHAHFDRAGGLSDLKRWSGAQLWAAEKDAPRLSRGGRGDFAFGDQHPYPPLRPDHLLRDGDTVSLGGTTLTAHLTPGHTAGSLTWSATVRDGHDGGKALRFVLAGSTSLNPGVRLLDRPGAPSGYPGIAADYERTFAVLKALPCDLCVAPHALPPDADGRPVVAPKLAVDPAAYREYLKETEAAFRRQLEEERAEGKAGPKG